MVTFHWKHKTILQFLKQRLYTWKTVAGTLLVLVCLIYLNRWRIHFHYLVWTLALDVHAVCFTYQGRVANLMFQYAFHYSFARSRNLQMVKLGKFDLNDAFILEDWNPYPNKTFYEHYCGYIRTKQDIYDCGYDESLEELGVGEDVHVWGYFQSWRYWRKYEVDIRKMYKFRQNILDDVKSQLDQILHKWSIDLKKDKVTLVGVHIRRGDYVKVQHFIDYGYLTAPPKYLYRAMKYMRKHYGRCLFVVCTNDLDWSRQTLEMYSDVHFVSGNSAFVDLALLSIMNHTIMTVGTYGWWAGFLTNGTTIYYRYPFTPGTNFAKQFRDGKTDDHFYPGWIAME